MTGRKALAAALLGGCIAAAASGCGEKSILNPDEPVTINVWHYYNGSEQEIFADLVNQFNGTRGKELGIFVEESSYGSVHELADQVMLSVEGKAGAEELPNIFAAYADTAYEADQRGFVADLSGYFTQEELDQYVDGYIEEGYFSGDGSLKIIPVAKSVELLMLNRTDWDKFAAETGASLEALETWEGLIRVAKQYYEWTDAKTDRENDGSAFFGREAMANYMLIGYRQMAEELFEVKNGTVTLNFQRDIVKRLWDCYYIPYIMGYFETKGRYCSEDIKTGDILCCVASSSSVTFFPREVILSDDKSYPIELTVLPCPKFEGEKDYAVQQGAGMVVTKGEEREELASAEFLKWLTQEEQNVKFTISIGYMPVTKTENNTELLEAQENLDERMKDTLEIGLETVQSNQMYTTKAFRNGSEARSLLNQELSDRAKQDRTTIIQRINSGTTLESATIGFCQDAYFDSWYQSTKKKLEALLQQ